jgi:hypothetical protein
MKAGYMFGNDGFLNDTNMGTHKSLVLPAPFLVLSNTKNNHLKNINVHMPKYDGKMRNSCKNLVAVQGQDQKSEGESQIK